MKKIEKLQKILISRLRFMGDIILTTPLIQALAQAYPQTHLAYLAETPYISLLENHPDLREIIPFDFKGISNLGYWQQLKKQIQFLNQLRAAKFDLAIDLFGNPRSALQCWLSGAPYRIGGDFKGRGKLYNIRIDNRGKKLNAIQFHLQSLRPLGIPIPEKPVTAIYTTPSEDHWAEAYLSSLQLDLNQPIIGIHPGASWPAKMWLLERFVALIRQINTRLNFPVLLTHGPGEEIRLQQIRNQLNSEVFVTKRLTLRQLAAVLKKLTLYVSNDCGPLHLAVAVGTKTLGIFGSGEPEIWFPYPRESGHRYIHKPPVCWPCHRDFCDTLECMSAITVDEIFYIIEEMLCQQ